MGWNRLALDGEIGREDDGKGAHIVQPAVAIAISPPHPSQLPEMPKYTENDVTAIDG